MPSLHRAGKSRRHSKARRKDIHFVFKPHPDGERYHGRTKGIKTHVYEYALGANLGAEVRLPLGDPKGRQDKYFRTQGEYFEKALKAGVRIIPGERASPEKIREMKSLLSAVEILQSKFLITSNVQYLKHSFVEWSAYIRLRHEIITQNIVDLPRPLEVRIGASHSILSAELKNKGVRSSRAVDPRLKGWDVIVTERLLRGANPDSISTRDYLRGYVSSICGTKELGAIASKKEEAHETAKDVRYTTFLARALVDRLSEQQLLEVVSMFHYSRQFDLLFAFNGLSPHPSKKQLTAFLRQRSPYYRRERDRARMRERVNG